MRNVQQLVCIKIGGSIITDKQVPYQAKKTTIRSIALALKEIRQPLLLAHGSGSFGHTSAKQYGGKNGYTNPWGIAKVARDAEEINRIVMDIFIAEGIPAISFSPRSCFIAKNGNVQKAFFEPILQTIKQGLIPVLYGDVIWDIARKSTIFSGETILTILCNYLQRNNYPVSRIMQLSASNGVVDSNNIVIPTITQSNWNQMKQYIKEPNGADVTGGMKHKVEEALQIAKKGVRTYLIDGNNAAIVRDAFSGKQISGTLIR
jgi:isopentenyl phosphate kinase